MHRVLGQGMIVALGLWGGTGCVVRESTETEAIVSTDFAPVPDELSSGDELVFDDQSWQKPLSRAVGRVVDAGKSLQARLSRLHHLLLAADSEVGTAKIDAALAETLRDYQSFVTATQTLEQRLATDAVKSALQRRSESAQAYDQLTQLLKGIGPAPGDLASYETLRGRLASALGRETAVSRGPKTLHLAPRQRDAVAMLDLARRVAQTVNELSATTDDWLVAERRGGLPVGLNLESLE